MIEIIIIVFALLSFYKCEERQSVGKDITKNVLDTSNILSDSSIHWTRKADFGGTARNGAISFSIGTGTDNTHTNTNDFWEYNP